MSTKSKSFGKKLLIAFVVLIGIAAIVFAVLHMAYRPTDDKDRITNETDIKLSVETSKETVSPFIKTYDARKIFIFLRIKANENTEALPVER